MPDSVRFRNDCRLAAQVVATGRPAPHADWAYGLITTCGPEGGRALAEGLRALRAETDTARLEWITAHTHVLRDGAIFEAAMAVADDRGASRAARVYAFRTLVWLQRPSVLPAYGDLVRPFDANGQPTTTCGFGTNAVGFAPRLGAPLPADAGARIRALGTRVVNDRSEDAAVRSAAVCAAIA